METAVTISSAKKVSPEPQKVFRETELTPINFPPQKGKEKLSLRISSRVLGKTLFFNTDLGILKVRSVTGVAIFIVPPKTRKN